MAPRPSESGMNHSIGDWIARYWWLVLTAWLLLAIGLRMVAPRWDSIAADGDLAFLPKDVPNAVGQRALESAFPESNSRSQLVVVLADESSPLSAGEIALGLDFARHLHWMAARNAFGTFEELEARRLREQPLSVAEGDLPEAMRSQRSETLADIVRENLTQVIEIETALERFLAGQEFEIDFQRLPDSFQIRGKLLEALGDAEGGAYDLEMAKLVEQAAAEYGPKQNPFEQPSWSHAVRDVWTWRSSLVGHKLGSNSKQARLISIQLSSEVTATSNIELVNAIESQIADLRSRYQPLLSPQFKTEISGSAAVGADMLRAAESGVRKTEFVTVALVLLILIFVYRSPLLITIPLVSIGLALVVSTSVVALLARDPLDPSSGGIGVFTTTRIFVVVLLFGAGTDFCLFLLARCRENLEASEAAKPPPMQEIVSSGWTSVHRALIASACTTIVGLALMWFSRFEKFQYSGPIIAICLAITLLVCLSFTPAMLRAFGRLAFWPYRLEHPRSERKINWVSRYWGSLAKAIVAYPKSFLGCTVLLLSIPAIYGYSKLDNVTYDLSEELSQTAPSRRGARLIESHFTLSDSSPITILLVRNHSFASDEELQEACSQLSVKLYVDGVSAVRGLTDPLGDYPPGKHLGLFDSNAWRKRFKRIARDRYVSSVPELEMRTARFDVLLADNPFSIEANATLQRLNYVLAQEAQTPDSPWYRAIVSTSGTTVGVTDLREITQSDQRRIQLLVTFGVWLVLVFMLRKLILSSYLVMTVLLSYFATLGATYFLFSTLYAGDYSGIDWKVPLFLFVILVAVGQDYNVYLVTRIFEECESLDLRLAVQRAVQLTGGIITSCGFVMAGTFVAMTSPAVLLWLSHWFPQGWIDSSSPVLRGMTELGFALSFGVLLDTLLVRSILVPAFVVIWSELSSRWASPTKNKI